MIGKPGTNDTRFSAVAGQGISTKSTFTTLSFGSPVGGALMASLTNDDGKLLASILLERLILMSCRAFFFHLESRALSVDLITLWLA